MHRGRRDHLLATVLFTDIVGSSEIAAELGDRRWRVVMDRHHAIVRKALKRRGGREIDNAGDGFFVAFDDQADAIRCACEISDAVRELGIEIRAGLHVGQSEIVGGKLGGFSINVAARVMSQAGAGEVLVSAVMRDLVAGSGFVFEDRGVHQLKGIPGEWRLYAVIAVDGTPREPALRPEDAARAREAIMPPQARQRRAVRLAAASAVLAVVLITAAVQWRSEPGPGSQAPIEIPRNSLVRIDPSTSEIVAVAPLVAPADGQMTAVPERREVWVLSPTEQIISVVDEETNEAEPPIPGFGGVTETLGYGIVYHAGSVWVIGNDSMVHEIGTRLGNPLAAIDVPDGPSLLAEGFGRVWVQFYRTGRTLPPGGPCVIVAIDPERGLPVLEAPSSCGTNGIAVGEGAVWVSESNFFNQLAAGHVVRVDPHTAEAIVKIPVGRGPADIAIGFDSVWVANVRDGTVSRIDPATDRVVATIEDVGGPSDFHLASGIAPAAGSIWVAVPTKREVVRIDPATNQVVDRIPLRTSGIPFRLIAAFGNVWVTVA